MRRPILSAALVGCFLVGALDADEPAVSGDAVISGKAGDSFIIITTTTRTAGAISSLKWGGTSLADTERNSKEFLDSYDHGRQLQSAANFDCGGDLLDETFNPTEAGSLDDDRGPTSSSKLLRLRAGAGELETTTRMAFWLAPGEKSSGHPAKNEKVLSDHLLTKRVHIGHNGLPHAIEYDVTFTVPEGEHHTRAVFEALTGYMPPEFSRFRKFDGPSGELRPLEGGPGEQPYPVVLATPDGSHAMGVYSPDQPSPGFERVGYGHFRFPAAKVNKWNCVFRVSDPKEIAAGKYHYRMFVAVGTLEDVRKTLAGLWKECRRP